MKNSTKTAKSSRVRKTHDNESKARAKSLYLRGLSLKEVSEFLNISIRTLEFWQQSEKWAKDKQLNPIFETAYNLRQSGKSLSEIAESLQITKRTVSNYLRKYENYLTENC